MKNYKLILTSVILAAAFGCTNPEHYDAPEDLSSQCGELTPTRTVQSIIATSETAITHYDEDTDDIVEAYVTSSDEGGNFYKSLSLVSADGTTGFSIPIDDYNTYATYGPGRKVYVNLKGLHGIKDFGGSVSGTVIGALYNRNTIDVPGDDEVGRISGVQYKKVITASCSDFKAEEDLLQVMTIAQAKNDANLNKLIALDNVEFTQASLGNTYFDKDMNTSATATATDHKITDINDDTVVVRVSSFSTFAAKPVATGSGRILGVMTKFVSGSNSTYQFMLRTERDVQLNNPRLVPPVTFFSEGFDNAAAFANWNSFSVTGALTWILDSHGNPGSCARMSGFVSGTGGGTFANEDWLISPVMNLSSLSNAMLSFQTATRFAGNPLEVLISTDYSGTGNPNSATWTPITGGTLATMNTSSYTWTPSGAVNISAFTGPGKTAVYLAYKFTCNNSTSPTWEVDNVKIIGN